MTALWEIQRGVIDDKVGNQDAEVAYGVLWKNSHLSGKSRGRHKRLRISTLISEGTWEATETGSVTVLSRRSGVKITSHP